MEKKTPLFITSKSRIDALTDGVYAIAMTLLALNLIVSELIEEMNEVRIMEILSGMMLQLDDYFLSFMLLAIFWIIQNEQMHYIRKTDRPLIWIQIFSLIFIVLIPATTSLIAFYGGFQICDVIFETNILIIGLLFLAGWFYVKGKPHLLHETADKETIDKLKIRPILIVIFSVIALLVSFLVPGWSTSLYFLLPVLILESTLWSGRH
ncbi:MAG: TMEM175 family protein [Thermodesulfobacteriota bacterium]|nr:TMEM175 family protein [Thermodesulfobacteriota bacterium]